MKVLAVLVLVIFLVVMLMPQRWHNRVFHPGYGCCFKCERTWDVAPYHATDYTDRNGCFPLCKKCWRELGTPEKRLPYYRMLIDDWNRWGHVDENEAKWLLIRKAVENEK